MVDGYRGGALRMADGDFIKSDYILNCSIAEYYTRVKDYKHFSDWKKEAMKIPKT